MAQITKIVIGIQARSTSHRLPEKIFLDLDGKTVLQHVIDACNKSARYMNKFSSKTGVYIENFIVCPFGDKLIPRFKKMCQIIQGPEDDVLSRYKILLDKTNADYVVRVTGDCPLIPPFLITKHIKTSIVNQYDYCSNVDPKYRTSPDGYDVEVISAKLLNYLNDNAKGSDREHVTPMARHSPPAWAKLGCIVGFYDFSGIKISLDTLEDFEKIKEAYFKLKGKQADALKDLGVGSVHKA